MRGETIKAPGEPRGWGSERVKDVLSYQLIASERVKDVKVTKDVIATLRKTEVVVPMNRIECYDVKVTSLSYQLIASTLDVMTAAMRIYEHLDFS